MPSPQELTITEAASLLGVHRTRIDQLIKAGKIRITRHIGPLRLVRHSDVLTLKAQPRKPGRPRKKSK